ncbi:MULTISPECIES: sugar phosphate nucleotidyltransferase [Acidobacterium]|uniref:Nucleotidyl transferase family protein n=1 Tax=Acidobacterium capsulatum (strain ATCC 51196 / DSM 11244 / BCRC 80197 / JCM 7670 / NBRC 15755 / NCIMB 13165 / 161) TaxID=240015 RepID=C1F2S9_ACIC5|nr:MULTISPECIES: sugar phosphate nucleotidyltransferase [Acidobacterium]ACO34012.1 Nucleotidyl transferase family protein [Acidobacterium capsulatum ATCC 51196]
MSAVSGSEAMPPLALLAGGRATRLYPLTQTVPKSLMPVAGEPFLAHQLRWLAGQGVRDVVLCSGHLASQIREYAGDGEAFGVALRYSDDGERALGTGGAIRRALPLLGEAFLVMYGDSLLTAPLAPVWRDFQSQSCAGLMTVFRNENRWDASNVETGGGRVLRYEKGSQRAGLTHIDYGLSVFRAEAFQGIPDGRVFDLRLIFDELIARGELACHEVQQRFYEIGSFEGLHETEALLNRRAMARPGARA